MHTFAFPYYSTVVQRFKIKFAILTHLLFLKYVSQIMIYNFFWFLGQFFVHGLSTFGPCWVGVGWRAPDSVSLCKGKTGITAKSLMNRYSLIHWYEASIFIQQIWFHQQCHLKSLYTATQNLCLLYSVLYCLSREVIILTSALLIWRETCDFSVITMTCEEKGLFV